MTNLFVYHKPAAATRTLKALRAAWPGIKFDLVPGGANLAFTYVIRATMPNGKTSLVARTRLASFARMNSARRAARVLV